MLTSLDADLMKQLADHRGEPSISVYIPTHIKGPEVEQDHIHLKNAVTSVEGSLTEMGVREDERRSLLAPIIARLEDRDFWRHQGSSLAIFRSATLHEEVRLAIDVEPKVRIRDRFLITPLIEATGEKHVHVLVLSRSEARLFEMGRYGGSALSLPEGVPTSMEEANWFTDRERQLQDRPKNTGGEFHGHGATSTEKADLRRFLRELSEGVKTVVGNSPVVVAAVTELAAAYKHESRHRVADPIVAGNFDGLDAHEIHSKSAETITGMLGAQRSQLVRSWNESLGGRLGTKGIIDTVIAAHHGRVGTLLVGDTNPIWGSFNADESEVFVFDERGSDHRNLVDDCIRATLSHSGQIVKCEEIDAPVGALLRY